MPKDNKSRDQLKKCLALLVELDCELEKQSPEWYSRAMVIAEINDFYISVEFDDELNTIVGKVAGNHQDPLYI